MSSRNAEERTTKPTLHIFRGLPGSGKTTEANKLGCLVVSPQDMYSVVGGEYRWNDRVGNVEEGRKDARFWAEEVVRTTLSAGADVAVAEVLATLHAVRKWLVLANWENADYRVVDMPCDVELSLARNIHNVPGATIRDMAARWEPWPL